MCPYPKGKPESEEHKLALGRARKLSPAFQAARQAQRWKFQGIKPPLTAAASVKANASLKKLGLTKSQAPYLWSLYQRLHLSRLQERENAAKHKQEVMSAWKSQLTSASTQG